MCLVANMTAYCKYARVFNLRATAPCALNDNARGTLATWHVSQGNRADCVGVCSPLLGPCKDNDEDNYCSLTAAAEHASCHVSTQRRHSQSKSEVEHDAFPPGDEVFLTSHACQHPQV